MLKAKSGATLLLCVLGCFVRPALAARPTTSALLERAERQVEDADYEQALVTLRDALASPDNSNADLARLYWAMGEVRPLHRDAEAADVFDRLLHLEPDWEPPRLTAPHVLRAFDQALAAFRVAGRQVVIELPSQVALEPGRPSTFGVTIRGLLSDLTARLYFRRALTEAWQSAHLAARDAAGLHAAALPAFPAGSTVEYYVEIQGPDGRRVTGAGSALAPHPLRVRSALPASALEPDPEPVRGGSTWWIWATVGGAVLVSGVVAFIALQPDTARLDLRVTVSP